jgi:hypothetical protein
MSIQAILSAATPEGPNGTTPSQTWSAAAPVNQVCLFACVFFPFLTSAFLIGIIQQTQAGR